MRSVIQYGAIETTVTHGDVSETVVEKVHNYVGTRTVRYTRSNILGDKNAVLADMLNLIDEFDKLGVTCIEFKADKSPETGKFRVSSTWTIRDLQ